MDLSTLTPDMPEYWTALRRQEKKEWPEDPAPVHTSRDPWPADFEAPKPCLDLAAELRSHGFETRLTYGRGFHRSTAIGTYREVHSVAVRFNGHGRIGFACYESPVRKKEWKWTAVGISRPGDFPFMGANVSDLRQWAEVKGSVHHSWFSSIAHRVAVQKSRKLCGKAEKHEEHTWKTGTGTPYLCSGNASQKRQKETA